LTLPVGGDDDEDGSEKRELPRPVTPFDALKNRMASTEGEGPPPSVFFVVASSSSSSLFLS